MSHAKLVSEETAQLEAREKLLAKAEEAATMGRDAFVSHEMRSCRISTGASAATS